MQTEEEKPLSKMLQKELFVMTFTSLRLGSGLPGDKQINTR